MPMKKGVLTLALCLFMSHTACAPKSPPLVPRVIRQGERVGADFWLAAPYVICAKITSAKPIGGEQRFVFDRVMPLILLEFTADVENVLSGSLVQHELRFYFFIDPDQRPRYYLDPGRRYILSLRKEAGMFRSMSDVTQLAIPVYSGKHNGERLPNESSVAAVVARLLLTPGSDYDKQEFRSHLAESALQCDRVRPAIVAELLNELLHSDDRDIRDSACVAAAQFSRYLPSCLPAARESRIPTLSEEAQGILSDQATNLRTEELLASNPTALLPPDTVAEVEDQFRAYTQDGRASVRRNACLFLRRIFPTRVHDACDQDVRAVQDRTGP